MTCVTTLHPRFDLLVVGGGMVGLSVAYQFMRRYPDARVAVLEKEAGLARHQTGRNSGVLHSGIYYQPGSYKAKLCVKGYAEIVAFARENEVAHDICGKLIVATNEAEAARLPGILERGRANGLDGLRMVGPAEMRAIEPKVRGVAAIRVPQTGIVDFPAVVQALARVVTQSPAGNRVLKGQEVTQIRQFSDFVEVLTRSDRFMAEKVVVCGGLQADRLARMDGLIPEVQIVPFRGDYYDLRPEAVHKVRHLIYPVPNPAFPFLGVHFTRMVHGGVECGPNAVFSFAREGYSRTAFNARDTREALGFSGVWRLFARHWRHGIDEYRRAFSQRQFLRALQAMLPDLQYEDLVPARCGIRAMALDPSGNMVDDFVFQRNGRVLHVLNAPSPAATAGLAIGREVVSQLMSAAD